MDPSLPSMDPSLPSMDPSLPSMDPSWDLAFLDPSLTPLWLWKRWLPDHENIMDQDGAFKQNYPKWKQGFQLLPGDMLVSGRVNSCKTAMKVHNPAKKVISGEFSTLIKHVLTISWVVGLSFRAMFYWTWHYIFFNMFISLTTPEPQPSNMPHV